jgi:hypothetical protein
MPGPAKAKPTVGTTSSGEISRVPCPWCKGILDCSGFAEEHLAGGWGEPGWPGCQLDTGYVIECEHCQRPSVVVTVVQVTVVKLAAAS